MRVCNVEGQALAKRMVEPVRTVVQVFALMLLLIMVRRAR